MKKARKNLGLEGRETEGWLSERRNGKMVYNKEEVVGLGRKEGREDLDLLRREGKA